MRYAETEQPFVKQEWFDSLNVSPQCGVVSRVCVDDQVVFAGKDYGGDNRKSNSCVSKEKDETKALSHSPFQDIRQSKFSWNRSRGT